MSTKNPRINVTFSEDAKEMLNFFAQKDHKSIAAVVRELTLEAMELREDCYLSKLADKLDDSNAKLYTHEEVWKEEAWKK